VWLLVGTRLSWMWICKGQQKEKNKLVWYEQWGVWAGYIHDNKGKQLIFEQAGLAQLDKGLYNKAYINGQEWKDYVIYLLQNLCNSCIPLLNLISFTYPIIQSLKSTAGSAWTLTEHRVPLWPRREWEERYSDVKNSLKSLRAATPPFLIKNKGNMLELTTL